MGCTLVFGNSDMNLYGQSVVWLEASAGPNEGVYPDCFWNTETLKCITPSPYPTFLNLCGV